MHNLIHCKKESSKVFLLKGYIEEQVMKVAQYSIDNNATVSQTAKHYGISKSKVYADVIIQSEPESELCGW